MSDETGQGEQEQSQKQHSNWWGDPISEERQARLDTLAAQQRTWAEQPEATRGESPLNGVRLSGADLSWLAPRVPASPYKAQLKGANLRLAQLKEADLRLLAQQEGANLRLAQLGAHLEGATLYGAYLERAYLVGARLEGATLNGAQLEGADLTLSHLEGATLVGARLEGADLRGVHLEDADLSMANLKGADLFGAHLAGADLYQANLKGVDLSSTWLDSKTQLGDATLDQDTQFGDIHWSGMGSVDLTQINWDNVHKLGDEHKVSFSSSADKHKGVVRAYRQVAAQLRAQGMADEADRFAYRAQIRQRGVLLRMFQLPQYIFSWILYILAGYGYQPWRTLFWYVATIATFAWGYLQVTHGVPLFGLYEPTGTQKLQWYEALVLSLASFHGRGFFPQGINLGDPVAILAASEAVIGLFVEISFIATFTQRYFANK